MHWWEINFFNAYNTRLLEELEKSTRLLGWVLGEIQGSVNDIAVLVF